MDDILQQIRACTLCQSVLPLPPRPVVQAGPEARILLIGQAPGRKVNETGIPWNDASGQELRRWLGITPEQFYDPALLALVPMGFCYPGKGAAGDLPPRPECAPLWHDRLLQYMPHIQLTILIGQYAQKRYLADAFKPTLTDNVRAYRDFLPKYLPLVHPSPRNKIWQKKNPWFEQEVIPELQRIVQGVIAT